MVLTTRTRLWYQLADRYCFANIQVHISNLLSSLIKICRLELTQVFLVPNYHSTSCAVYSIYLVQLQRDCQLLWCRDLNARTWGIVCARCFLAKTRLVRRSVNRVNTNVSKRRQGSLCIECFESVVIHLFTICVWTMASCSLCTVTSKCVSFATVCPRLVSFPVLHDVMWYLRRLTNEPHHLLTCIAEITNLASVLPVTLYVPHALHSLHFLKEDVNHPSSAH